MEQILRWIAVAGIVDGVPAAGISSVRRSPPDDDIDSFRQQCAAVHHPANPTARQPGPRNAAEIVGGTGGYRACSRTRNDDVEF